MNNVMDEHTAASERHEQLMRGVLLLTFAATSLVSLTNINDSTLFKPAALVVGSSALLTLWLARAFAGGELRFSFSRVDLAFTVFIVASIVSLFFAANLRLGLESLAQLSCLFTIFLFSRLYVNNHEKIQQALNVILAVTAVGCGVAIIQFYQLVPSITLLTSPERQVISTFGNTTYFAGFLVLILPLVLSQALTKKKYSLQQASLVLLVIVMLCLLMITQTRSAWFATLVSFVLFGGLYFRPTRSKIIGFAGIIVVAGIVAFLFPDIIRHRLVGLFEMNPASSFTRRLFFYAGAWKAFLASPLIGNGIGNFIAFLPKFRPPDYWMFRSEDIAPHAHNEFLEVLSETGFFGFIAFFVLLSAAFIVLRKKLNELSGNERTLLAGSICGLAAILIDNLASMNLRTIPVAIGFWMVMGMSIQHPSLKVHMVTIPLPSILRRAQIVPYLFFMVFILIFARMVFERYEADKNYFEGDLLNFRGDRATASGKFDEALVHNPHHSLARFYAAANLIKAGKYVEARDHIKFLLKEYPYYPKAHLMLALSSFELGDTATAQSELNAEMTIDASPQTLYIASYFAFRLNKKDKELQTLQLLLEQNVKSGISDYAAQSIGRLTELCDDRLFQSTYHDLMLRFQEKFPSDLPILTAIGECLIKFDQVKEAKSIVDRALALNPNDPMFAQRLRVLKEKLEAGTAH